MSMQSTPQSTSKRKRDYLQFCKEHHIRTVNTLPYIDKAICEPCPNYANCIDTECWLYDVYSRKTPQVKCDNCNSKLTVDIIENTYQEIVYCQTCGQIKK